MKPGFLHGAKLEVEVKNARLGAEPARRRSRCRRQLLRYYFLRRLKRPTWNAQDRGAGGVSALKRTVCPAAPWASFRSSVSNHRPERKDPNGIGLKATGGQKSLTYWGSNCVRSDCVVEFAFGPGGQVWSECDE
jgi:hypothetical protein